ncbi:MAG: fructosamine kinase family protein [Saprospiraceae bacterium]|nr:fructosamine kinase family protein [Saprospiraceae bacterium]
MPSKQEVLKACAHALHTDIITSKTVTGGDINQALRIETDRGLFFLKYHTGPQAAAILGTEKLGLEALRHNGAVPVPPVVVYDHFKDGSFLVLPFITPGIEKKDTMHTFGQQLARLHRNSKQDYYGFTHTNFIGRLPQSNNPQSNGADFLAHQRLYPQWKLARQQGYLNTTLDKKFEQLLVSLPHRIPEEGPSLIHGDLWNGNYIIDQQGKAWIIDPAASFSLREMDLAMSKLFGGFATDFYQGYQSEWPTPPQYAQREPIYQMYYLLAHLNLFGKSYEKTVQQTLLQIP